MRELLRMVVLLMISLMVISCGKREGTVEEKYYPVAGLVVSVDREKGKVVISQGEIPGFMSAMTMEYSVNPSWYLSGVQPGDSIDFVLAVIQDTMFVSEISTSKSLGKTPSPQESPSPSSPHSPGKQLTLSSNGYDWNQHISKEIKVAYCKELAKQLRKGDWQTYYSGINEAYNTQDASILSTPVHETAAMIGAMVPSRDINKDPTISTDEMAIYRYMESRWDYYEKRDGRYIIELHDPLVLEETARKFGITKQQAFDIWVEIGMKKY